MKVHLPTEVFPKDKVQIKIAQRVTPDPLPSISKFDWDRLVRQERIALELEYVIQRAFFQWPFSCLDGSCAAYTHRFRHSNCQLSPAEIFDPFRTVTRVTFVPAPKAILSGLLELKPLIARLSWESDPSVSYHLLRQCWVLGPTITCKPLEVEPLVLSYNRKESDGDSLGKAIESSVFWRELNDTNRAAHLAVITANFLEDGHGVTLMDVIIVKPMLPHQIPTLTKELREKLPDNGGLSETTYMYLYD